MRRHGSLLRRTRRKVGRIVKSWRLPFTSRGKSGLYDAGRTYWIDPERIKLARDFRGIDRLDPNQRPYTSARLERGLVVGGDWDVKETIPFEEMDVWRAFHYRYVEHGSWEETGFYRRILRIVNGGHPLWGCTTREQLHARMQQIDLLFADIKETGYRTQEQLRSSCTFCEDDDEIHVHIGRHGDYIFADGRHRLCIAKILGLEKVPVKVARRHSDWVELRKRMVAYAAEQTVGKIYAPVLHPDLADLPAQHGHERMDIIREHVKGVSGRALDIGAHWGYFCHCLEDMGFECTAVELSAEHLYFLWKLRRAENKSFAVFEGSMFDLRGVGPFDVVLALNIFHHSLKEEASYNELIDFLGRVKTKLMFFEAHLPSERQMQGSFCNYSPDDFVSFVMRYGGFGSASLIGTMSDGRPLFKLES